MSTVKKSPATRCNGDQAVENLAEGLSTDHDTRTAPKPRKPKHRTWHISAGRTPDGRATALCGWVSKPNPLSSSGGRFPTDYIPVKCPDCDALVEMQRDAVNRRARAEKLTEFILDALDKKGL